MRSDSRESRGGRSARRAGGPQNEIIINATPGETRVGLLEQGQLVELHIEREGDRSVAGMVAKGRVTRVLPGMQAAFVDIGLEKAAFLYVGDYREEPGPGVEYEGEPQSRRRGRNGRNQRNAKIDTLLQEGQEIVVQVAKEPIGSKGARITSHVSIAGRHLVLTPWSQRVGVSRRIDTDRERRRLREIVARARPADLGFIIRTAGGGAGDLELEADIKYLTSVWDEVQIKKEEVSAPATLFTELSLPLRAIRDFANSKTKRIVIDDAATHEEMAGFLSRFVADPKPTLEHYSGSEPIFQHFGLESRIEDNLGKKVQLKSGGHLVFDQSEALTAIDVNTGRFVGKRDLEETVLKTNLEAVKEVVYQLRFRNIGGLIIIDLIDMESAENRERVYRALREAVRSDKAKTNILKISELGLVEMTRKRTRESLVQQLCEPCGYCHGRGYVMSAVTVAHKVLRQMRSELPRFCGRQLAVSVAPEVAEVLLGAEREALAALGDDIGLQVEVRARPGMHQEQFEVSALDEGEPVDFVPSWLREAPEPAARAAEEAEDGPEEEPGELRAGAAREAEEEPEDDEAGEPDEVETDDEPVISAERLSAFETLDPFDDDEDEPELAAPATSPEGDEDSPDSQPEEETELVAAGRPALDVEEESPILPRPQKSEGS